MTDVPTMCGSAVQNSNAFSHSNSDLDDDGVPRLVHKGIFNHYEIFFKKYIKV